MNYEEEIETLKDQVDNLSSWLWGKNILNSDITNWLDNFKNEREKYIALNLLSQFMFYDLREVRQAMKSIYKDKFIYPIVSKFRKETDSVNMQEYEEYINDQLSKTLFASVGNPSESSSLLLYFFRQRNKIPKDLFIDSCRLLTSDSKYDNVINLVYLDDISGSGGQAITTLSSTIRDIRKKRTGIKIFYITIFATTQALTKLRGSKLFDEVETIFELDETYKVFSDKSRYFTKKLDLKDRDFFEDMCRNTYRSKWNLSEEDISRKKDKSLNEDECGYADGQLALGFFYNVPNNTLPIFWAKSKDWTPIFKRYSKQYMGLK